MSDADDKGKGAGNGGAAGGTGGPTGRGAGGRSRVPPPPARRAKGFLRAGSLIDAQMRTNAGKRGFAQARLAAIWPDVVGPDLAPLCTPVKLAPARGPAGGTLTLAVSGALAPQVQMMVPTLRERVNRALGPGAVGRIVLTHAVRPAAPPPAPRAPAPRPAREPDPELAAQLSSIGDPELRAALETFARNVLSRTANPKQTES